MSCLRFLVPALVLAIRGPCLTIRKFPAHRFRMDDLIELGSVSPSATVFMRACVIDRKNIALFREHFVEVRVSSPRAKEPPGFIPDALIPFPEAGAKPQARMPRFAS